MMCILIPTVTIHNPQTCSYSVGAFLIGSLITDVGHHISPVTISYHLQPSPTQCPKLIAFKPHNKIQCSETPDVKWVGWDVLIGLWLQCVHSILALKEEAAQDSYLQLSVYLTSTFDVLTSQKSVKRFLHCNV